MSARARLLTALLFALPGVARADLFSPGPLSKAHEKFEGIKSCTLCHAAGAQLSPKSCLDCHTELKDRVAQGEGFHGKLTADEKAKCQSCHHEHQGREFKIVDWGKKGRDAFDHAKTGFLLLGKHADAKCAACHDTRLIEAAPVKKLLAEQKGRETFLGLGVRCLSCHFDEHRAQEAQDCKQCHDEKGWKKAAGFNHAKTAFVLDGAHVKVSCDKCHAKETDAAHAGAFPKPVSEVFERFKPVVHDTCTACHKDVHDGRFGARCTDCHTTAAWKDVHPTSTGGAGERAFHEQTRYPLRGAHVTVACESCHGTGKKAQTRGLAFARCTDCHVDAHQGQFGKPESAAADCTRCHSLDGFTAPRFEVEDHAKTKWPLDGAHRNVACLSCHVRDEAKVARAAPALLLREAHEPKRQQRAVKLSPALFVIRESAQRCEACHADVHGGQFREADKSATACTACHVANSFHDLPRFDHAKTRFPLESKHAEAACAACHFTARAGSKAAEGATKAAVVQYRGVDTSCAGCHLDVHAGQFAQGLARADCAKCHEVSEWKKVAFVHAPPQTRFALDGAHEKLECKACHAAVEVKPGVNVVRYKPLPVSCEGCHVDQHDGAFRKFVK